MSKLKLLKYSTILLCLAFLGNGLYHLSSKPTELFDWISFTSAKTPDHTWQSYKDLFQTYQTNLIRAEFLAALAQTESSGDPAASPPWVWRWSTAWDRIFSPASTAVGLFQFTKGTFELAQNLCVREGQVIQATNTWDINGCFLRHLYSRVVPSHSIEAASAYLHQGLDSLLGARAYRLPESTRYKVASVYHLCGPGRALELIRNGYRISNMSNCGSHSPALYWRRVSSNLNRFKSISQIQTVSN